MIVYETLAGCIVMEYTKKNLLEIKKMSIEQLSRYYMEERKYKYENNVPLVNIELRKKIHSLLLLIIKIDRLLVKETLTTISDDRIETNNPKIYACTHIGGNDIQRTFEAIKEHAYLFLGDPKGVYKDMSGLLLFLNGVIPFETCNKQDRFIAKERSIELLKNGGDLLIYPEGAWNITPNLPVMKLFDGTAVMALETGADIIPVGIEQYGNDFYASIGRNIITSKLSGINKKELSEIIRDSMATQKWQIYESQTLQNRENFNIEIEEFQQEIVDRCDYGFTVQDVLDTMYKDKTIINEDEVFSFVKRLAK